MNKKKGRQLEKIDYTKLTDVELISIMQEDKNENIFEEIYRRYYKMIFNYFKRYVYYLPDDILEELSDDVFVKVYYNIYSLKDLSGFKRWIFQIAHNICVNYVERQHKKGVDNFELETIADNRIDIEKDFIDKEMQNFMLSEVEQLDDKMRELIVLKYFQNLTYEEISKINKSNVRKCKYDIKKALLELHDKIKIQGFVDE